MSTASPGDSSYGNEQQDLTDFQINALLSTVNSPTNSNTTTENIEYSHSNAGSGNESHHIQNILDDSRAQVKTMGTAKVKNHENTLLNNVSTNAKFDNKSSHVLPKKSSISKYQEHEGVKKADASNNRNVNSSHLSVKVGNHNYGNDNEDKKMKNNNNKNSNEEDDDNDHDDDNDNENNNDHDDEDDDDEDDDDDDSKIRAYARLDFPKFTFYVQTLQVLLGRKVNDNNNNNNSSSTVDVHLGSTKAISRRHAKIFYNFGTQRFELSILGRNGAFVDDIFIETGVTLPLKDGTKIQIGEIPFKFVLPKSPGSSKKKKPIKKQINPSDAINLKKSLYNNSPKRISREGSVVYEDRKKIENSDRTPTPPITSKHLKPPSMGDLKVESPTTSIPASVPAYPADKLSPQQQQQQQQQQHQQQQQQKSKKEKQPKKSKQPKKVYTLEEIPEQYRTKPSLSYSQLIERCLKEDSSEKGMSLSEIYNSIKKMYPYFYYCQDGWQSSVRHNLSLNKLFKKVSKEGKGWLWGLDEEYCSERDKLNNTKKKPSVVGISSSGTTSTVGDNNRIVTSSAGLNPVFSQTLNGSGKTIAQLASEIKRPSISTTASPATSTKSSLSPSNNSTPSIQAQLAANRSRPTSSASISQQAQKLADASSSSTPQQSSKDNNKTQDDTKRALNHLQAELIRLTKDRKGLDKQTTTQILTQALAMTIAQVSAAAKSSGMTGNPLVLLIDKNAQHLTKILTAALNAATYQITKGKVKPGMVNNNNVNNDLTSVSPPAPTSQLRNLNAPAKNNNNNNNNNNNSNSNSNSNINGNGNGNGNGATVDHAKVVGMNTTVKDAVAPLKSTPELITKSTVGAPVDTKSADTTPVNITPVDRVKNEPSTIAEITKQTYQTPSSLHSESRSPQVKTARPSMNTTIRPPTYSKPSAYAAPSTNSNTNTSLPSVGTLPLPIASNTSGSTNATPKLMKPSSYTAPFQQKANVVSPSLKNISQPSSEVTNTKLENEDTTAGFSTDNNNNNTESSDLKREYIAIDIDNILSDNGSLDAKTLEKTTTTSLNTDNNFQVQETSVSEETKGIMKDAEINELMNEVQNASENTEAFKDDLGNNDTTSVKRAREKEDEDEKDYNKMVRLQ